MASIGDSKFVIFGGFNHKEALNDTYIFDLITLVNFEKIILSNEIKLIIKMKIFSRYLKVIIFYFKF